MPLCPDAFAWSRRRAHARLAALAGAAALGGVALLTPAAQAQTARPGGPQFGPVQAGPFGLGDVGDNSAPSVADLDGDGDLDVLSGSNNGPLVYFENTGTSTVPAFARGGVVGAFGLSSPGIDSAPSVADIDGDGDLDVLAGDLSGSFTYFENTAGPGATPAFADRGDAFGLGDIGRRSTPSVVDFDGDGDLDVLSGEFEGSFFYFENTAGPGSAPIFLAAVADAFGLDDVGHSSAPTVADFDNDGDLDVLSGEIYSSFIYSENTAGPGATPVFAAGVTGAFGLDAVEARSRPSVADLDGDGDLDVLSGEFEGSFFYFENTAGSGTTPAFKAGVTSAFDLGDLSLNSTPSVADLDGDGDLDVFAGRLFFYQFGRHGQFVYFENTAGANTTPTFNAGATDAFGLDDARYRYDGYRPAPSVADLDGDGDLDVLAGEAHGLFIYLENTADPGASPDFAAPVTNPFGLDNVGYRSAPSVADLDSDGDLDVLTGTSDGHFVYFENTAGASATPTFNTGLAGAFGLDALESRSTPSIADLDGDGDLDVLAGQRDGSFAYFENTAGAGNAPIFINLGDPFGFGDIGYDSAPSMADLDGDGDLDVLAGNRAGRFYYFENTGKPVAVDGGTPTGVALSTPSPNPARSRAALRLAVPEPQHVRAVVYDALGRQVAVAFDGDVAATAEIGLDAKALAPGVYVVRVTGAGFAETRTLTVVR